MTKLRNLIQDNKEIERLISEAKLEYISDTSWGYKAETEKYCIDFYQDEKGHNHIEQFVRNHNGQWFDMIPTASQGKMMFDILNATPYREVQNYEDGSCFWNEPDSYESTGTNPKNFY